MKPRRKNENRPQAGQIRIIGGQWRGRKLPILDAEGLRPTTDRNKETLFNWLMHDIHGARVLDMFAGSGSLGFEALSRYASFAHFFELDKTAAKQLLQNLNTLNCTSATVINESSLVATSKPCKEPFDIIFIDPPFHKGMAQQSLEQLINNHWLAEDGLIYLEQESALPAPALPEHLHIIKEKKAGQVSYFLIR